MFFRKIELSLMLFRYRISNILTLQLFYKMTKNAEKKTMCMLRRYSNTIKLGMKQVTNWWRHSLQCSLKETWHFDHNHNLFHLVIIKYLMIMRFTNIIHKYWIWNYLTDILCIQIWIIVFGRHRQKIFQLDYKSKI